MRWKYYWVKIKDYLLKSFKENKLLKITALLITLIIFAFVHGGESVKVKVITNINFVLPSEDSQKILVSTLPEELKLTIQGPKSIVYALKKDGISAIKIDLSQGLNKTIYFEDTEFQLPIGVKVVDVTPATARVQFEKDITREIKIILDERGIIKSGLKLKNKLKISPLTIKISGAESILEKIQYIKTDPIDLSSLSAGDYSQIIRLINAPQKTRYLSEPYVSVFVSIESEKISKTWRHIPIQLRNQPEGINLTLDPGEASVTIEGAMDKVNQITEDQLTIYINLETISYLKNKVYYLPIEFDDTMFNNEKLGVKINPSKVSIRIGAE